MNGWYTFRTWACGGFSFQAAWFAAMGLYGAAAVFGGLAAVALLGNWAERRAS